VVLGVSRRVATRTGDLGHIPHQNARCTESAESEREKTPERGIKGVRLTHPYLWALNEPWKGDASPPLQGLASLTPRFSPTRHLPVPRDPLIPRIERSRMIKHLKTYPALYASLMVAVAQLVQHYIPNLPVDQIRNVGYAALSVVAGYIVHRSVTPNSKVLVTTDEVPALKAEAMAALKAAYTTELTTSQKDRAPE